MKPSRTSIQCLSRDQIEALLRGDLSPRAAADMEDHFSLCQACRVRVEAAIGLDGWWSDASDWLREEDAAALKHYCADEADGDVSGAGSNDVCSESDRSAIDAPDPAVRSQTDDPVITELLDLLGPTEFPEMLGRIGVYEIAGVLGYGGMGGVFKGFDRSLHRFVAIKMMLPHLAVSAVGRERFAREAKAIAAVVDDHVMAIHSVDQWKSVPYFVMPLVRGESLRTRLDEHGPLGIRETLRISMQAARGLAASHAQGIIHRDVKPANIFLDGETDRAQLVDFGIAVISDDPSLTMTGNLTGTPQFMSPEQARGEPVTASSDLFSLGTVIYSMCTGQPPFHAETAYGVLRMITDKPIRPMRERNPSVPEWLDDIVGKLMAKQPHDRFGSAKEVANLLQDCLAHVQQPTSVALPVGLKALRPHDRRLIDRTQVPPSRIAMVTGLMAVLVWGFAKGSDHTTASVRKHNSMAPPHRVVISGRDRMTIAELWLQWKEMPVGSAQELRAQRHLWQVFQEETNVASVKEYLDRRCQWANEILPLVTSGVGATKAAFLLQFLQPLGAAGPSETHPMTPIARSNFFGPKNRLKESSSLQSARWDVQTALAMTLGRVGCHTDANSAINELIDEISDTIDRDGGSDEVVYLGHQHAVQSVLGWCRFYQAAIENMSVETMESHLEDNPEN